MSDTEFIQSFNNGYTLADHNPELAQKLCEAMKGKNDDRAQGFISGREQLIAEKAKEKGKFARHQVVKAQSPKQGYNDKEKSKDKGKDKD